MRLFAASLAGFRIVLFTIALGCAQSAHGAVPKKPADALRLGTVDFPTSGAAAAQPHFSRGVAALHSFWYEEALAAFHAALRIDPHFAMAWWGVAMSYHRPYVSGSDHDAGRRALANIRDTSALTARERAYIDALRVFYADGAVTARTVAYAAEMKKLHRAYPDDQEAAAFHALALLGHWWPYTDGFSRQEEAGAIALEVYRRNPGHPGAAHYVIHSFDDPSLAGRALMAARHYAKIAPDAPHALHMPSHIFLQLGMWPETVAANEAAWAASEEWVRRNQASLALRDYHNYHWLIYACLQQGRYAHATELVNRFLAMRRDIAAPSLQSFNRAMAAFVVETGRWDQAESIFAIESVGNATPSANTAGRTRAIEFCGGASSPTTTAPGGRSAVASFMRAYAAAARGASDAAQRCEEMTTLPTDNESGPEFWRICVLEAVAVRNARAKEFPLAIAAMREAVALEELLGKNPGPPPSFKPPHELFGEILLQAGKPGEAAAQFANALDRHPNRALSLLGRARAAAALGDTRAASAGYAQFLETWRDADTDLPAVREAREFVQARSRAGSR